MFILLYFLVLIRSVSQEENIMIIMLTYLKISQNSPPVMLKNYFLPITGLKFEDGSSSIVAIPHRDEVFSAITNYRLPITHQSFSGNLILFVPSRLVTTSPPKASISRIALLRVLSSTLLFKTIVHVATRADLLSGFLLKNSEVF